MAIRPKFPNVALAGPRKGRGHPAGCHWPVRGTAPSFVGGRRAFVDAGVKPPLAAAYTGCMFHLTIPSFRVSRSLWLVALAAGALAAQERFDHVVRNGFFAGFAGNQAAMDEAMAKTEAVLKVQPDHAEALVWHGAGLYFQSGQAFRKGDQAKGIELYERGLAEMDRAVALAPKSVGVRIPRGAVLLQSTVMMPPDMTKPLIEKGLSDYLAAYEVQQESLAQLGTHPKGELLFGLANAYRRLGDDAKAQQFFDRIVKEMSGTVYAKRAQSWFETKTLTVPQQMCAGCHTPGK